MSKFITSDLPESSQLSIVNQQKNSLPQARFNCPCVISLAQLHGISP